MRWTAIAPSPHRSSGSSAGFDARLGRRLTTSIGAWRLLESGVSVATISMAAFLAADLINIRQAQSDGGLGFVTTVTNHPAA